MKSVTVRVSSSLSAPLALRNAFRELAHAKAEEGVMKLPGELQLKHELLPLVVTELNAAMLRRLILVQDSAALGFFASSLRLRCPQVEIVLSTGGDLSSAPPPATPSQAPPARESGFSSISIGDTDDIEYSVRRAFSQLFGESAAALCFAAQTRLPPSLVGLLCDLLGQHRSLRFFALVHDNPSTGFFTSSIGLRCPWVRIESFTDVESARAAARRTAGASADD